MCVRPAGYAFDDAAGGAHARCTRHAIAYPRVRDHAIRVALVVGVILFVVNQLDVVLRGQLTALVAVKVALTFAVPYAVSTYSALQMSRRGAP